MPPFSQNIAVAWITTGSNVTLGAADVLSTIDVSQVGASADAYYLHGNPTSSSVLYTMSNSIEMAECLAAFLVSMDWKYVSLVHSDNEWSLSFVQALEDVLSDRGICILDSTTAQSDASAVVSGIVIAFGERSDLERIIPGSHIDQLIVVESTESIIRDLHYPSDTILLSPSSDHNFNTSLFFIWAINAEIT
jgi:hypothetical protein